MKSLYSICFICTECNHIMEEGDKNAYYCKYPRCNNYLYIYTTILPTILLNKTNRKAKAENDAGEYKFL